MISSVLVCSCVCVCLFVVLRQSVNLFCECRVCGFIQLYKCPGHNKSPLLCPIILLVVLLLLVKG